MFTIKDIKPIPFYIKIKIDRIENNRSKYENNITRFYSYFDLFNGELVIVHVAVKTKRNKVDRAYKQIFVHGMESQTAFCKQIEIMYCMGGVNVDFRDEHIYNRYFSQNGIPINPNWYESEYGYLQNITRDPINLDFLFTVEKFQYCAYDGKTSIYKFIPQYLKHPKIEMFCKLGIGSLARSPMIIKKAEKDKKFLLFLRDNAKKVDRCSVQTIYAAYKNGTDILYESSIYKIILELKSRYYNGFFKGKNKREIANYLYAKNASVINYYDYCIACEILGLDMTEEKNAYPHDFQYWHDMRIDQKVSKQAELDAIKYKKLNEGMEKVSEKYKSMNYENKGLCAICAKSKTELIREGEILSHCVGRMNYDQRMIKESSLIFFIRKVEEKDKPFVTMELSLKDGTVLQCYAEHDTQPELYVKEFVYGEFQERAQRILKAMKLKEKKQQKVA